MELSVQNGQLAVTFVPGRGGVPLLFVHGQLGARSHWSDVVGRLEARRPCAALDLPWHGASTSPTSGGFERFGEAVLEVMAALGWTRARLVGHSLGALAVLDATLRAPERVDAMLLVGLPPDFDDEARRSIRAFAEMLEQEGLTERAASALVEQWYSRAY